MIELIVDGKPIPKGRPRFSKWGAYTPKTTAQYEKLVSDTFALSKQGKLSGGLKMELRVYMPIPKVLSKKLSAEMEGTYHTGQKDLDNIIKAVSDALNSLAYDDDGQICIIEASKKWSVDPRVEIKITKVEE